MNKLLFLFYALACTTFISCMHHDNDINITYSEFDHYYLMNAHFSKSKTRDVEKYMDGRIGGRSNTSFVNSRIDRNLALNDHTTFYIKKYPGYIEIKLDKNENSYDGYHRIKTMCQGIKKVLVK